MSCRNFSRSQTKHTKADPLGALAGLLGVNRGGDVLTLGMFICSIHRQFPVLKFSCKTVRQNSITQFIRFDLNLQQSYTFTNYGTGYHW